MKHVIIPNPEKDGVFWDFNESLGISLDRTGLMREIDLKATRAPNSWRCLIMNKENLVENKSFWEMTLQSPLDEDLCVWWHVNIRGGQDSRLFEAREIRERWNHKDVDRPGPGQSVKGLKRHFPFPYSMEPNEAKRWDKAIAQLSNLLKQKPPVARRIKTAIDDLDTAADHARLHFVDVPLRRLVNGLFPFFLYWTLCPGKLDAAWQFVGGDISEVRRELRRWSRKTLWPNLGINEDTREKIFQFKKDFLDLPVKNNTDVKYSQAECSRLLDGFEAVAELLAEVEKELT